MIIGSQKGGRDANSGINPFLFIEKHIIKTGGLGSAHILSFVGFTLLTYATYSLIFFWKRFSFQLPYQLQAFFY